MISDATKRSILRSIRFYDDGQFEAQHAFDAHRLAVAELGR
jgi:hypothetical protein